MNTFTLPDMVRLPEGDFVMGESEHDKFANDTERPSHRVSIARGTAISRCPVTVGQFRDYMPEHSVDEPPTLPVVKVTWHDAVAYCDWLSSVSGARFRLPSEAEWECACRAGSRTPFSTGHSITISDANFYYAEDGQRIGLGQRTPVGAFAMNAFGFQDMHGGVCEWVADSWHANYEGAPVDGSAWPDHGSNDHRVLRGGAWDYLPRLLRSSWRDHLPASSRRDNVGFRVATNDPNFHSS